MLPHNALGRKMLRKLKVYAGPQHPHSAQFRAFEKQQQRTTEEISAS
jgi:ribosomal protein L13